jgi:hypothetical protein
MMMVTVVNNDSRGNSGEDIRTVMMMMIASYDSNSISDISNTMIPIEIKTVISVGTANRGLAYFPTQNKTVI